jgi:hypothetical protein
MIARPTEVLSGSSPPIGGLTPWFRGALALNVGLTVAAVALWVGMAVQGRFWQADFTAFYTGWAMVLDGRGAELYDLQLQAAYQGRLVSGRPEWQGVLAYVYPPHSALPPAPLALLPLGAAFYVWALLQLGMLALVLRWLCDICRDWDRQERLLLIASVLAFPPLLMTFQLGQLSLLGLLSLVGFYRGLKRGRTWEAAAWLVAGTGKPQVVLLAGALLVGARRWRVLGAVLVIFAAWAGLTTAFFGWSCWRDFLLLSRHNAEQFGTAGIYPLRMYNFKCLLTGLLGNSHTGWINVATLFLLMAAGLFVLWLWRGPWRPEAPDFDLRVALTLLVGLVCSPHLNPVDVLALVLPAVLFYGYVRRSGRGRAAVGVLLALGPLLFLVDSFATDAWPGSVRPFFLVMLLLAGLLARALASADCPPESELPLFFKGKQEKSWHGI